MMGSYAREVKIEQCALRVIMYGCHKSVFFNFCVELIITRENSSLVARVAASDIRKKYRLVVL